MCLAIPARIVSIDGASAVLDMEGNSTTADVSLVPGAAVGDYVIVHAGLAIQRYDAEEAAATLEALRAAFPSAPPEAS